MTVVWNCLQCNYDCCLCSLNSDLLGDYEFDVELDYDENMEEIEGHPPESQKPEDGMLIEIFTYEPF